MPKYIYKARDNRGKLIEGVEFANSKKDIVGILDEQGLLAVSVEEVKGKPEKQTEKKKKKEVLKRGRIRQTDIALFCRQMATMINAGVSIIESIEDIAQMVLNSKLRKVLQLVADSIRKGDSLSEAMKRHPRVFNRFFVSMVRAGEESGNLDLVLNDLSKYLENGIKLQRKMRSASMYPMFIGGFFFLVVIGLVLFLIPRFKTLFSSMGAELPLPTKIVMNISDVMVKNLPALVVIAVGIVLFFVAMYKNKVGRYYIDSFILRIPIAGILITKAVLTRFFSTLATLLKSGVDIVASLEIAGNVISNLPAERIVSNIRIKIMEGSSLAAEMGKHPLFPRMPVRMVSIGEKAGKIDEMLNRVAEYYTDEVDATVEGFSSLVEPVLIVFLGLVVGLFIIAMYLPIFKMALSMMEGGGL
ncbi:type II secretion system F family protein [Elusimicrobiota bacterium]